MTLRRFLVLFESHHVDRTHGVEASAHFAVGLIFGGEFLAGDQRDRRSGRRSGQRFGHQDRAFDAEFVQTGVGQMLQVGLQFGCRRR